jgi:hypothetical protein
VFTSVLFTLSAGLLLGDDDLGERQDVDGDDSDADVNPDAQELCDPQLFASQASPPTELATAAPAEDISPTSGVFYVVVTPLDGGLEPGRSGRSDRWSLPGGPDGAWGSCQGRGSRTCIQ